MIHTYLCRAPRTTTTTTTAADVASTVLPATPPSLSPSTPASNTLTLASFRLLFSFHPRSWAASRLSSLVPRRQSEGQERQGCHWPSLLIRTRKVRLRPGHAPSPRRRRRRFKTDHEGRGKTTRHVRRKREDLPRRESGTSPPRPFAPPPKLSPRDLQLRAPTFPFLLS